MAKIALKNVLIEYQINVIDKYGDIVDTDHLKVFIGKNRYCRITDPIAYGNHSKLITTLPDAVQYCIANGYNDIEVLITATSADGEMLREHTTIDYDSIYFYNGDYAKIPSCVFKNWTNYKVSNEDINIELLGQPVDFINP